MKWTILSLIIVTGLLLGSVGIADPSGTYTRVHDDGLVYTTNENGVIKLRNEHGTLSYMGFAITGTIGQTNYSYTSEQFTWSWSKTYYNVTELRYNETLEEEYNLTYPVYVYRAYNNVPYFNWTQEYVFAPYSPVKIRHIITNDLGYTINNTKLWYVHAFDNPRKFKFHRDRYNITNSSTTHLQGNFSNVAPILRFFDYEFNYFDLIDTGFTVTDVIIGRGTKVGYPNKMIVAVAVTKNNGVFPDGVTVELDPESTSFLSPDTTGDPTDQWTNGDNLKTSNNQDATETTVTHKEDTSVYDITTALPSGAIVVGIEVRLEGNAGFCPI